MKLHIRARLAPLVFGLVFIVGCGGWRVRAVAPNQLNGEIARGGIALPPGTTPVEGNWRESSMHGSGLQLKLSMTSAAYKSFRSATKCKPILSTRDVSEEAVRAKIPPVISDTWAIQRGKRQVMEAGGTFGTHFAALVEADGAATVYLSQFY
jgi:hypothetical protein